MSVVAVPALSCVSLRSHGEGLGLRPQHPSECLPPSLGRFSLTRSANLKGSCVARLITSCPIFIWKQEPTY